MPDLSLNSLERSATGALPYPGYSITQTGACSGLAATPSKKRSKIRLERV
jgi:hypothetical protein